MSSPERSFALRGGFFIVSSLASRSASRTENPNRVTPLDEGDDQQPARGGVPEDELAPLTHGMLGIVEDLRQRITENPNGLLERNLVLAQVGGGGLSRIPLEARAHRLTASLAHCRRDGSRGLAS